MGAGYLLPLMDVAATSIRPISQIHFELLSHGSILHIVVLVVPTVMAIHPITTSLHIEVSIASAFKGIIGYLELLARENVASEVLIWIVSVFLQTNML